MANNPPCNNSGENNQLSIFSRMGFTKPVAHVHQYTAQEVFSLPSFLVEKWKGKAYRLVIQRQKRMNGELDLWEGEYTYRCILTNDHKSCR